MKPTKEEEKKLLGLFKKMESQKNRNDLVFHAEAIARAQEALKADYGLVGPDAPLFNGIAASGPMYADYRPVPMGAALAREAV